jgi:hypothetical protein
MQPGPSPENQQHAASGRQPAAGWPPATGGWAAEQPSGAVAPPAAATSQQQRPRRGRPGLVLLVAVLVEIIVIAAADNQTVAQRVSDAALRHPGSLGYDFALALLTFQWRFSPAAGDRFHSLYGQWALIGVFLVVTAFLVAFVARGRAGFARVFFGTWAAVVVAAGIGAIVRAAIVDGRLLQGRSRFQNALFSDLGPSQYVFVGGLGVGLLVALAAAFTAVAARRDADVAASAQPASAQPASAQPAQQVPPREPDPRVDASTTQFERAPVEPEPTRAMPRVDDPREDQ